MFPPDCHSDSRAEFFLCIMFIAKPHFAPLGQRMFNNMYVLLWERNLDVVLVERVIDSA